MPVCDAGHDIAPAIARAIGRDALQGIEVTPQLTLGVGHVRRPVVPRPTWPRVPVDSIRLWTRLPAVELGKCLATEFVLKLHFKCIAQYPWGIDLHGDTPQKSRRTGCGVSGRPRATFDFLGQLRVPGTRHMCVGSAVPPSASPITSANALANGRASSTGMRRLNSHRRLKFSTGSRDELITHVGGRGKSSMRNLQPLSRSMSAPKPQTPIA